ncbi:MAG: hypothetical protein JXA49_03885, partial [Actinobacteria bacterium]|nr:hypothetical protein [Actinomycetota bacterium]
MLIASGIKRRKLVPVLFIITAVVSSGIFFMDALNGEAVAGPGAVTARKCAHSSIGVTAPSDAWYLAEGSTEGGFETW